MVLLTILLTADVGSAQAQQVALKTNLLYDATTTPNIGVEMGIGKKQSVQLFYGLNPWKFGHGDDMKYAKHWILNPEYRYWFCQRFNGSFVGIHAFGGETLNDLQPGTTETSLSLNGGAYIVEIQTATTKKVMKIMVKGN